MANNKQAIKRNRQRDKRRLANRLVIGTMRSAIRKARTAIDEKAAESGELVRLASRTIDRAVSKGTLHRRTASRLISRLTTRAS